MGVSFEDLLLLMLNSAPDPNEPLPLSNRKETIYGATVPFLFFSWVAVVLRLWTRFKVVNDPGWDDALVVMAVILNTAATACILLSIEYGLGQHFLYLGVAKSKKFIFTFYLANAIYITNTGVIKMSLCVQYLRVFKAGIMRRIVLGELIIVTLWVVAYGFMAWVPCFPVSAYWNREGSFKCYGYGFDDLDSFIHLFESHTALNMVFDLTIFITPMVLLTAPNLRRNNILGLAGVFLFGAVVVLTAVWRLYSIVANKAATYPYVDFTWWPPISIILSCLEIDLAIMCASMPVFWPIVETRLAHIFVTHEVRISEHRRLDENGYELEHTNSVKSGRSGRSGRSGSGQSQVGLTEGKDVFRPLEHYKDQYVVQQVDPLAIKNISTLANETAVETKPKQKWVV